MEDETRTVLDQRLEESLQTTWNARVVEYDHDRFPFADWILDRIRQRGHPVDDLTEIHEKVGSTQVYKLTKDLCADTNLPEFRKIVNQFVRDEVVPKGKLQTPVAVQRFLNVRIMLPSKPQSIFPFHTGLLYSHGAASRSLWLPLTDVSADEDATASMQILDINTSRKLVQQAIEQQLSIDQMTEFFARDSWQCKAGPGKVVFFNQENVHGNFVNETGKTRVSIDFRLAEARFGDRLGRKIPGGYFEIIADTAEEEAAVAARPTPSLENGRANVIYLCNATKGVEGAPVHLQRYMVYDYCRKNDLNYEFELFELEDMKHLPTLSYIGDTLKSNVIMYSVFALPEDADFRREIIDRNLENGTMMHFVNEDMVIWDAHSRDDVEKLLQFAKY